MTFLIAFLMAFFPGGQATWGGHYTGYRPPVQPRVFRDYRCDDWHRAPGAERPNHCVVVRGRHYYGG